MPAGTDHKNKQGAIGRRRPAGGERDQV